MMAYITAAFSGFDGNDENEHSHGARMTVLLKRRLTASSPVVQTWPPEHWF